MCDEGTQVTTTNSCGYRPESAADFGAGKGRHRAAVDKGQACGTGPREAFDVSACKTGCTSIARKTCRICSNEASGR